jgi:Transposase
MAWVAWMSARLIIGRAWWAPTEKSCGQSRSPLTTPRSSAFLYAAGLLASKLIWAVDLVGAPSATLLALLARADQSVRYASGRVVAAISAAYVSEGKTDAKDANEIAETARLRRDLAAIDADVRNLAVLTGHWADLIAERVRMINRPWNQRLH